MRGSLRGGFLRGKAAALRKRWSPTLARPFSETPGLFGVAELNRPEGEALPSSALRSWKPHRDLYPPQSSDFIELSKKSIKTSEAIKRR